MNLLDNVHVINLERSKDRLLNIDNNLRKFNVKYSRFNAIDGKELSQDEIKLNTSFWCRYFLCNRSIIGCAMSHITLWNIISKSEAKWHLILEDDVEFTNETINFINKLAKTSIVDEDNIIINLSCTAMFCNGPEVIFSSHDQKDKVSLMKARFPLGMVAYFITKNTAEKLYNYFEEYKINYHIDNQIAFNLNGLGINYYATNHSMINFNDCNSTIGSKSLFLLSNLLTTLGLSDLVWYLSIPIATFNLSVTIDGFFVLFFILLFLNLFLIHSPYIYIYLILELIIAIILRTIY